MAETLKVLGQNSPAANTLTSLYQVPAGRTATVSTIVVCNRSGSTPTFRLSIAVGGASDSDEQYLFYDVSLPKNASFTATLGITLGSQDLIRVRASSADVSFNAFGVEIS